MKGRIIMVENEQHIVSTNTFIRVWLSLLALTALTVITAKLGIGAASVLIPLFIASVKAGLVLWFFMHLKYEKKLFKLMLLMPIATVTIILIFTFFDLWYR